MDQAFRYLVVQVIAYALDYGTFALCLMATGPLLANLVGKAVAGAFAFLAHRRWTFGVADAPAAGQALRYLALLLVNIPLSSVFLVVMLNVAGPMIAKVVADIASVALTYTLARHVVFVKAGGRRP